MLWRQSSLRRITGSKSLHWAEGISWRDLPCLSVESREMYKLQDLSFDPASNQTTVQVRPPAMLLLCSAG